MSGRRMVAWTPLPIEECKARLTQAIDAEREDHPMHFPFGEPPSEGARRLGAILNKARGEAESVGTPGVDAVVGGVLSRDHLTLFVTQQVQGVPFADSFARRLVVALQPERGGTRLKGSFRMLRLVRWFLGIWVTGFLIMYAALLIAMALGAERHGSLLVLLAGPPVLLLFAVGVVLFSRWISKGQERTMIAFLERVLGASIEDGPAG